MRVDVSRYLAAAIGEHVDPFRPARVQRRPWAILIVDDGDQRKTGPFLMLARDGVPRGDDSSIDVHRPAIERNDGAATHPFDVEGADRLPLERQ